VTIANAKSLTLVVESVVPFVAEPVTTGAAVLTGAEPPLVGGPPALVRMPTSSPVVTAAEPAISSNPAQAGGFVPPANVGLPLMFGAMAFENRSYVFAANGSSTAELPALFLVNLARHAGSPFL
jgi:hypothetical protein